MILYGDPQTLLGASSTELEVLYGSDLLGRSFIRRQASKAKRVVKKTPIAKVARVAARVAPVAVVARVAKRNAPVAARVTTRVVKKAAPVARQVLKNPLVRNAAASLVPGGPQALSLYSRLTAAKKEIIPKFTTAPAPAQPKPQTGRPPRKPRQRVWKPALPQVRTQAPAPSRPSQAPAQAQDAAQASESFFTKHKTPLLVGGGALGVGLLALLALKKKQG